MAGRPTRARTIEEIGAKLEPWALPYLYLPELEARRDFLVTERAKILTSEPSLFAELPQNEYTDIIVQLSIQGATHPAFEQLPEPVKEKFAGLNCQEPPLEHRLRHPFREYLHPKEGHEKEAKYFLNGMYNATKFINLYYKWVLTPPNNGRPNFYSCFINEEYPWEVNKLFKDNLVLKCDMIVHFSNMSAIDDSLKSLRIPKKQEEVFAYIKESTLNFIKSCKEKAPDRPAPYFNPRIDNLQKLGILEEIEKALEAVTWEDVNTRPSTRKEKEPSLFTGEPITFEKGGYYRFLEDFDKHNEKDAHKNLLANTKKYESPYSAISLEVQLSKSGAEKNSSTSKIIRTLIYLAKQEESTIRDTCELEINKEDYLRYMMLTEEQIKDPVYRQNFFARQLKQYAFLRSITWTIEEGKGKGRVGGIIDYAEINSKSVIVKFNEKFINSVFTIDFYPYQPCTLEANKIPDRQTIPYFLQIKLENLFTNTRRQACDKEEYVQLKNLISYLGERRVIDPEEKKYKEKLCNRIIEALDYLQNVNKSIEYYLCTTPDGPALEEELEKYKNRKDFPKLYLWFRVPALEQFLDPEEAKTLQHKFATIRAKRKERQERARDRKLGELEAERLDRAKEQAEAEAKAQSDQSQGKTLDEYFKGNQ